MTERERLAKERGFAELIAFAPFCIGKDFDKLNTMLKYDAALVGIVVRDHDTDEERTIRF